MKIMKLHSGRYLCLLRYRGLIGQAHVEADTREEVIRLAFARMKQDRR